MIANSDSEQVVSAATDELGLHAQLVVLFSKALNLSWQFCKKAPELLRDPRR